MSMMGGGMNFDYMPFMIVWWILIIIGIVTVVKWLTSQSHKLNKK